MPFSPATAAVMAEGDNPLRPLAVRVVEQHDTAARIDLLRA